MKKVEITGVWINEKDKNGNPFISKKGIAYKKMSIKTKEYGDKYLSGFCNKQNENWKSGDVVEILVTENGQYLNFEVPKKEEVLGNEIEQLKTSIGRMNFMIQQIYDVVVKKQTPMTVKEAQAQAQEFKDEMGFDYPFPDGNIPF